MTSQPNRLVIELTIPATHPQLLEELDLWLCLGLLSETPVIRVCRTQLVCAWVNLARDRFAEALIMAEKDLQAFLFCIESWVQAVRFTESSKLYQKFDECFNVKMAF